MFRRILFLVIGILCFHSPMALANQTLSGAIFIKQDPVLVKAEGQGSDIILIPGLASSHEVWSSLANRLRENHRLHQIQIAGFAGLPAATDSDGQVIVPTADAIADYIQKNDIKAPIIIGHSLGGEVALVLGARYPEWVERLIIVDALPFYSLYFNPRATSENVRPSALAFKNRLMATPPEQAEAFHAKSIARLTKTEAVKPALITAALQSDRETVANATYELMTTDLRPELEYITAKVNVIYAYDPLFGIPASHVDMLFRNVYGSVRNIQFKRIDNSFHFIMFDQPERFEQAVIEFIYRE
ncbi:alpha/beta hydrolase [Leminorella grimontii]|uniref:Alpha/beta hydrolase n=1 Tax=Leminorella grimontii TaxID=82981 RepID=A0AAV5N4N3_9GAMM|nr:alpha/beta hydrolase [Leminorella grimontii]KFC94612.1 BioH family biotin synthesis protein [Leminorella grimontii ATCC 33999 = DSM 5078]GKX56709.1 alpha/beta hydrolase [Leminorella grimontii]VFS62009.1 Sigma factor sigB regulation protein rsbQ [Leminorella grimontii]